MTDFELAPEGQKVPMWWLTSAEAEVAGAREYVIEENFLIFLNRDGFLLERLLRDLNGKSSELPMFELARILKKHAPQARFVHLPDGDFSLTWSREPETISPREMAEQVTWCYGRRGSLELYYGASAEPRMVTPLKARSEGFLAATPKGMRYFRWEKLRGVAGFSKEYVSRFVVRLDSTDEKSFFLGLYEDQPIS